MPTIWPDATLVSTVFASLALVSVAFWSTAPVRFAPVRFAPVRIVPVKFLTLRFLPTRFAPVRLHFERSAPTFGLHVLTNAPAGAPAVPISERTSTRAAAHPAARDERFMAAARGFGAWSGR